MGVGLDQDEYLNHWIVSSRQSSYIHAVQGLQEILSDRFVDQMDKKTNQLTRTYITIYMMGQQTSKGCL
jgi:hypothetical protein